MFCRPGARREGACDCAPEQPTLVHDTRSAELICQECGIVVEAHMLEENPYLPNHAPMPDDDDGGGVFLQGTSAQLPKIASAKHERPSDTLQEATLQIKHICSNAALPQAVVDMALTIYKDTRVHRIIQMRAVPAYAACAVYRACKVHGVPRTQEEVCRYVNVSKTDVTKIGRNVDEAIRHKPYATQAATETKPEHMLLRVLSRLGLNNERTVTRHALDLDAKLRRAGGLGSKNPKSVCSALIYISSRLASVEVEQQDIIDACQVCKATFRRTVQLACDLLEIDL